MKIALCLIVKNEEKVLARCLKSFDGLVDEIHITDTGSTDKTLQVASKFDAKIHTYPHEWAIWQDEETIVNVFDTEEAALKESKDYRDSKKVSIAPLNYGRARNFAQQHTDADVIFSLDADEYLHPESQKDFRLKVEQYLSKSRTILLPIYSGFNKEGKNPAHVHYLVRLFKNAFKWQGRIHEVVPFEQNLRAEDLILLHDKREKKSSEKQGREKIRTYIANLKFETKTKPENPRAYFYLANTYYEHNRFHEALNYYLKYLEISSWHAERAQALLNLGKCYLALNETKPAIDVLIRSAIEDPARAEPWCYLGDVCNHFDWKKACAFYEIATQFEGKTPVSFLFLETNCYTWLPWYRLSIGYDKLKNYAAGLKATKNALKYIPEDKDMKHNLQWYNSQKTTEPLEVEKISNKPVNIIIPSANPDFAMKCIHSITEAKTNVPYMITLVKDGEMPPINNPMSVEFKKGIKPFIFARNINLGITKTSDVIFLNDDATVSDYWLDELQKVAYDQGLGIVSPLVSDIGNPRQHSSAKDESIWWKTEPEALCFVCVYIPLEIIKKVGLLDEKYEWYGYEDNDYCLRARNCDFDLKICHTAFINHRRHSSFGESQKSLVGKAFAYHQEKWKNHQVKVLKPKIVYKNQNTGPKIIGNVVIETFDSLGKIIYGQNCEIRHGSYLEVLDNIIELSDHSVIGAGCVLQGNGGIYIGKGTLIGPHCNIYSTSHPDTPIPFKDIGLKKEKVVIGENVLLGANVTVLPGVVIGDNSIIGAHSLVNKDIPDGVVAFGTPARVHRVRHIPIERQTGTIREIEREHVRRYKFAAEHINHGDVVLDAGCGVGYGSQILIDSKRCRVVGVELSESASTRAKKIKRENLLIYKEDLTQFNRGQYDAVVCFEVIEHVKDDSGLLLNLWGLVKPGGKIIFSTPSNRWPVSVNPYHFKHYSIEDFKTLMNYLQSCKSSEIYGQQRIEDFIKDPVEKPDTYVAVVTKTENLKKKVLFTAGILNTDRPERWDYVLNLFQNLSNTFRTFNVDCLTLCHPILKNRSINTMVANDEILKQVMMDWKPDYVFVWNGNCDGDQKVIQEAQKVNAKVIYGELGWFPQKGHLHFDLEGVNAKISLTKKQFEELTPQQFTELQAFQSKFHESKSESKDDHILIALQDEKDSNIVNSRFKSMDEFVKEAVSFIRMYSNKPILVRPHPHFKDVKLTKTDEFTLDFGSLYESIMHAEEVHAINSTVLVEAALLGKKVVSYDQGLTYPHFPLKVLNSTDVSKVTLSEQNWILYQLVKRQLRWEDLTNPEVIKSYSVFSEILK